MSDKDLKLMDDMWNIMDALDGPDQECYPITDAPDYASYITDPVHGGKVTCHKCGGFIKEGEHEGYWDRQHLNEFPRVHFHKECYNPYEHYYGLDKPID